jgi:ATP-dependent Clp protease ATP-binding subunit ClpC
MNNFTPRAQKALLLAKQEAGRLGHAGVDSEHLLLGLLRLDKGIVATVLKRLDFDFDSTCAEIEKLMPTTPSTCDGNDLPYTTHLEKALASSETEAKAMGHTYTGTEHLLLGLLREEKSVAAQVFKARNIDLEKLRSEVIKQFDPHAHERSGEAIYLIRLGSLEYEFKKTRDELSKKFEKVIDAVNGLRADLAQLRGDGLKGNS